MKKNTKKQLILEVATRLFAAKGYSETSISEVAQLANTAEGTIFYYFTSKEGLLVAVLEHIRSRIVSEFGVYLEENSFSTGLEMMEGVLSFYLYLVIMKEDIFHLLHHRYPHDLAVQNEDCRTVLEDLYSYIVDLFTKVIDRGQQDGSIDRQLDSRKTSLILYAMVDGIARLNTNRIYHASSLMNELQILYKRMLEAR